MKKYLIAKSLKTAERLNQDEILKLVNEEEYTLEDAIEKVESDYDYVELEESDEIYEHLDYVLANNKTEAYEKYKENSLKRSTVPFYFFREQLEIIEIVNSIE
jgi:TPP-dependent 2-oxoacid decarboxylase